jgi:hypothetical protein
MYETQGCSTFGQQSVTDIAIASNQENEMRFEVDPTPRFRGRTSSDFIPKKAHTRKGKPSKPRPPRYFTDGRTRQYLNLLVYSPLELLQDTDCFLLDPSSISII